MHIDVYLPVLFSALFGVLGPAIGRRLPPARATWLLSVGAVLLAGSTAISLGLLALTVLGQQPQIAGLGHWAVGVFRARDPVRMSVAVIATALIPLLAALVLRVAYRRGRAIAAAYRACRLLPASGGSLVVDSEPGIAAYAVPGRPGRIVVTQQLLAALDARERRALLAHERTHLERHHHWHVTAVTVAAALNPLLMRLPAAVRYATERWADESAAAATGDRAVTAYALARTGLLGSSAAPRPRAAMCAAVTHVSARVEALLAGPPRSRFALSLLLAAVAVAGTAAALAAGWDAHCFIELVQAGH